MEEEENDRKNPAVLVDYGQVMDSAYLDTLYTNFDLDNLDNIENLLDGQLGLPNMTIDSQEEEMKNHEVEVRKNDSKLEIPSNIGHEDTTMNDESQVDRNDGLTLENSKGDIDGTSLESPFLKINKNLLSANFSMFGADLQRENKNKLTNMPRECSIDNDFALIKQDSLPSCTISYHEELYGKQNKNRKENNLPKNEEANIQENNNFIVDTNVVQELVEKGYSRHKIVNVMKTNRTNDTTRIKVILDGSFENSVNIDKNSSIQREIFDDFIHEKDQIGGMNSTNQRREIKTFLPIKSLSLHTDIVYTTAFLGPDWHAHPSQFSPMSKSIFHRMPNTDNASMIKSTNSILSNSEEVEYSKRNTPDFNLYFASCSGDETINIFNLSSVEIARTIRPRQGIIKAIAAFGKNLLKDSTLNMFEDEVDNNSSSTTTNSFIQYNLDSFFASNTSTIPESDYISKNKTWLVSGGTQDRIKIWDWSKDTLVRNIGPDFNEGEEGEITSLVILPDETIIVAGFTNGAIRTFAVNTGELLQVIVAHDSSVKSLTLLQHNVENDYFGCFLPQGNNTSNLMKPKMTQPSSNDLGKGSKYIVSASSDKTIRIWDPLLGKRIGFSQYTEELTCVKVLTDESTIAVGSTDTTITLWNTNSLPIQKLRQFKGHTDSVSALSVIPSCKPRSTYTSKDSPMFSQHLCVEKILSADLSGKILMWHARTTEIFGVLKGHTLPITSISNLGSRYLLSTSEDCTIKVWNIVESVDNMMQKEAQEVPEIECQDDKSFSENQTDKNDISVTSILSTSKHFGLMRCKCSHRAGRVKHINKVTVHVKCCMWECCGALWNKEFCSAAWCKQLNFPISLFQLFEDTDTEQERRSEFHLELTKQSEKEGPSFPKSNSRSFDTDNKRSRSQDFPAYDDSENIPRKGSSSLSLQSGRLSREKSAAVPPGKSSIGRFVVDRQDSNESVRSVGSNSTFSIHKDMPNLAQKYHFSPQVAQIQLGESVFGDDGQGILYRLKDKRETLEREYVDWDNQCRSKQGKKSGKRVGPLHFVCKKDKERKITQTFEYYKKFTLGCGAFSTVYFGKYSHIETKKKSKATKHKHSTSDSDTENSSTSDSSSDSSDTTESSSNSDSESDVNESHRKRSKHSKRKKKTKFEQVKTERFVAIKKIDPNLVERGEVTKKQFKHELDNLRDVSKECVLSCTNYVNKYVKIPKDFENTDAAIFLLSECGLCTIEELFRSRMNHDNEYFFIDYQTRKRMVSSLCQAVNQMHEKGFIHRDLHPSNVMIMESGNIKLTDFYFTKRGGEQNSHFLKSMNKTMNTGHRWQPFEVLRGIDGMSAHTIEEPQPQPERQSTLSFSSINRQDSVSTISSNDDSMSTRKSHSTTHVPYDKSVDIYMLGMTIYFIMTDGKEALTSQDVLLKKRPRYTYKSQHTENTEERLNFDIMNLIDAMLSHDNQYRPTIKEVLKHPFFKSPEEYVSLLKSLKDTFFPQNDKEIKMEKTRERFKQNLCKHMHDCHVMSYWLFWGDKNNYPETIEDKDIEPYWRTYSVQHIPYLFSRNHPLLDNNKKRNQKNIGIPLSGSYYPDLEMYGRQNITNEKKKTGMQIYEETKVNDDIVFGRLSVLVTWMRNVTEHYRNKDIREPERLYNDIIKCCMGIDSSCKLDEMDPSIAFYYLFTYFPAFSWVLPKLWRVITINRADEEINRRIQEKENCLF